MSEHRITLGLRENWRQFALLAVINAFVGAMVGLERTIVPLIAKDKFAIESSLIVLSFLISFGVTKALTNLFAGRLSEHLGRKKILVAGWVVGLGVPLLLIFAKSWGWVIVANILLGINQGLCWSTTVIMKVDLVGPKRRGVGVDANFPGRKRLADRPNRDRCRTLSRRLGGKPAFHRPIERSFRTKMDDCRRNVVSGNRYWPVYWVAKLLWLPGGGNRVGIRRRTGVSDALSGCIGCGPP